MEDTKLYLAKNIAKLRIANNMTQVDLAEKLHYSDKSVSKWERGESVPELCTIIAIADLFNVSLDYLLRQENIPGNPKIDTSYEKIKISNRAIITAISVLSVLSITLTVYIMIDIISSNIDKHWLAFIYAAPVSMVVWLVFNSIWFRKHRNYLIVSLLVWSLIAAIHITFAAFSVNIWQIYFIGIPAQIIIFLCSRLLFKRK